VLGAEEIPNPSDLWSALENELRPAIHYRVVLPLDVAQRFVGPLVFTKRILVEQGLAGAGPFEEIVQIAGTVRDGKKNPVAQAEVRVPEAGLATQTDAEGDYTFPNIAPGTYTFTVTAPGKKAREHKITVPAPSYDLRA
jgi:protocatechuate 3,4-dioxygenase beta subunit